MILPIFRYNFNNKARIAHWTRSFTERVSSESEWINYNYRFRMCWVESLNEQINTCNGAPKTSSKMPNAFYVHHLIQKPWLYILCYSNNQNIQTHILCFIFFLFHMKGKWLESVLGESLEMCEFWLYTQNLLTFYSNIYWQNMHAVFHCKHSRRAWCVTLMFDKCLFELWVYRNNAQFPTFGCVHQTLETTLCLADTYKTHFGW